VPPTAKISSLDALFRKETKPAARLVDPNFDQTRRCNVTMFVATVMRFAQTHSNFITWVCSVVELFGIQI
jgi:hypothetical protein